MAKTMKAAAPGALVEALTAKTQTLTDLSKKGFSRNTLRAINLGKPVKTETLESVARHLSLPVEHLLPPSGPQSDDGGAGSGGLPANQGTRRPSPRERLTADAVDDADGGGLLLKATDSLDIELELIWARRLTWGVDRKASREAHPIIRDFGTSIHAIFSLMNRQSGNDWGDLERELQEIEAWDQVKAQLARLADHDLHVLCGSYLHWSREEFNHPYEDYVTAYDYKSQMTTHLYIAPTAVKSTRTYVAEGLKPPKFSPRRGPTVYVNGRELPPEPVARVANDDPPADTANDDDIPF